MDSAAILFETVPLDIKVVNLFVEDIDGNEPKDMRTLPKCAKITLVST
jgi:hypothetical protein